MLSMQSVDWWCAQRVLHAIVELIAAVLPANAPCPTLAEVSNVTSGPAAEPIPVCANDCVLFRNAPQRHDPDGHRAALADLDACPKCHAPRFVKGTKRNRKIFWYVDIRIFVLCIQADHRVHTRAAVRVTFVPTPKNQEIIMTVTTTIS